MSEADPVPSDPRRARALRLYTGATAASFVALYGGTFGFAGFLAWWDGQSYPPFSRSPIWLTARLLPAVFLLPRAWAGWQALAGAPRARALHALWALLLAGTLVAIVAPAWLPFSVLATATYVVGTARDVLGLRFVGGLTGQRVLGYLAIAWLAHDVLWLALGHAVFVEPSVRTAAPVVTAALLGLVSLRALAAARRALAPRGDDA